METAEEKEQNASSTYYWWLPVTVVALFLLAFETSPLPVATTTATPQPTLSPTPTLEPVVIETAGEPDPDARFILNVIVEDEAGWLMGATVTVVWLNDGFSEPLIFEEVADVKIPIPAGWTPVLVSVTKPGYRPVQEVFEARLAEDLEHEWLVRLVLLGDSA